MEHKTQELATQPPAAWDDRAGHERLYRRYAPWLAAMLRKRFGQGFHAEAEDLVQETYERLAPHDPAQIRKPQALLMRVALNLARDRLRRRLVRGLHVEETRALATASTTQADLAAELLLRDTVMSIPEPYREVFILSRFGGLTYEEIATRCGLSPKSVEWRLSKAIAHCTKRGQD